MVMYQVTLDAYNTRESLPTVRLIVFVRAADASVARSAIRTPCVDREGKYVTLNGGAPGGRWYPEWQHVSMRKVDRPHKCIAAMYGQLLDGGGIIRGYVAP